MSEIDKLCHLLNERNVEWTKKAQYDIEWHAPDGRHCSAMYWNPTLTVCISRCTAEQAIAATLEGYPTKSGRGYYVDRDDEGTHIMCDDCGGYIGTAEEIAATLGCKSYGKDAELGKCVKSHERESYAVLKTENAKLRELIRELYEDQCDECDCWKYRDRLRELGVD